MWAFLPFPTPRRFIDYVKTTINAGAGAGELPLLAECYDLGAKD